MFVNATITLNEALGLADLVSSIKKGFGILPFKFGYRLNRQLSKLESFNKSFNDTRSLALKTILGDEKFEELAAKNTPINEALSPDQMSDFTEIINKELESEVSVELLSESLEDLIGNPDLEASVLDRLSNLIAFMEEKRG
jgi:hypothetical protein